ENPAHLESRLNDVPPTRMCHVVDNRCRCIIFLLGLVAAHGGEAGDPEAVRHWRDLRSAVCDLIETEADVIERGWRGDLTETEYAVDGTRVRRSAIAKVAERTIGDGLVYVHPQERRSGRGDAIIKADHARCFIGPLRTETVKQVDVWIAGLWLGACRIGVDE